MTHLHGNKGQKRNNKVEQKEMKVWELIQSLTRIVMCVLSCLLKPLKPVPHAFQMEQSGSLDGYFNFHIFGFLG